MDREVKELQLFLALQEYPLFSSSPLHRILVDALTRDNFLFPFCTITSIDCEEVPAVAFTPEETAALLRLLTVVLELALGEPAMRGEVLLVSSVRGEVLLFCSVLLEVLLDTADYAAIPHDLRFCCVLLFCQLATRVSKEVFVEVVIGETHYATLYRLFTRVSNTWRDAEERDAINRVLEKMRLSD